MQRFKRNMLNSVGLLIAAYGFLLVTTNRTPFLLFSDLVSYPRLNRGIAIFSLGWSLLFIQTFNLSESSRPMKHRKRKR